MLINVQFIIHLRHRFNNIIGKPKSRKYGVRLQKNGKSLFILHEYIKSMFILRNSSIIQKNTTLQNIYYENFS